MLLHPIVANHDYTIHRTVICAALIIIVTHWFILTKEDVVKNAPQYLVHDTAKPHGKRSGTVTACNLTMQSCPAISRSLMQVNRWGC